MRTRYTIASVRKIFEEADCKLLDHHYVNNKTPMRYVCSCGAEATIALQDFIRGVRCGCGRKKEGSRRRLSISYVRRYFRDHGCELLESRYVSNHTPMHFRCKCGNEGRIAFSDFQNGVRCGCRRHLGLHRKWTEERVVVELKKLIEETGRFPAANQLRKLRKRGLASAIQSLGGFNYYRRLLGQERHVKPDGYWKYWKNVESEMRAEFGEMIERGVCPNARMIDESGISLSIIKAFGGLPTIAERLGCGLSSCWKTSDGHVVFSFYEFILDEYLHAIGVSHTPNARIMANQKFTCDQKIGDYYIELFGYSKRDKSTRSVAYNRKRKTKERIYRKLCLNLVPLEKELFLKPYAEIERQLDSIFTDLGFDIRRDDPFDICELAQAAGFVPTEDEVVCQLRQVIEETGDFPTRTTLIELDRYELVKQIQKTGGHNHYRDRLGFAPKVKPNDYWTLEQTLTAVKKLASELGRLPTQKEMGASLAHAVQKHGGINQLATSLGLGTHKKPNGWWNEERIMSALVNEVIPSLGHYPNPSELQTMRRSDLFNAIARNGGFRFFRRLYSKRYSAIP